MIRHCLNLFGILFALAAAVPALARPTIDELRARAVLDDYESNVVFGYDIVMDTKRYAARYAGNGLNCTSCHLKGGTQPDGLPLNVAGVYPKWRSKNGVRNGLGIAYSRLFPVQLERNHAPGGIPRGVGGCRVHQLSFGGRIDRQAAPRWVCQPCRTPVRTRTRRAARPCTSARAQFAMATMERVAADPPVWEWSRTTPAPA